MEEVKIDVKDITKRIVKAGGAYIVTEQPKTGGKQIIRILVDKTGDDEYTYNGAFVYHSHKAIDNKKGVTFKKNYAGVEKKIKEIYAMVGENPVKVTPLRVIK